MMSNIVAYLFALFPLQKQVLSCLAAWQDWSVYPPGFLIKLQNTFVGLADKKVTCFIVQELFLGTWIF